MTTSIYDQHRAAFDAVSAYIVLKDGKRVASVAFRFPRDGAGRLYCYFHVFGMPMTRGFAAGGGYDKRSAACESAVERIVPPEGPEWVEDAAHAITIKTALKGDSGHGWDRRLQDAGFDVWQAV